MCVCVHCKCVCVRERLSPSDRFRGGEGLTVPGGTLMSHGNSDVMEAQPQLDLPMCVRACVLDRIKKQVCVCVCVSQHQVTGDW